MLSLLAVIPAAAALGIIESWGVIQRLRSLYELSFTTPLARFQPHCGCHGQLVVGRLKCLSCYWRWCSPSSTELSMAIDSPLLRQLRLREQENLSRAALLKKQRLQIEAEIAEMQQETRQNRAETEKLRAERTKLLFKLCEHLATNPKTSEQLTAASH